MERVLIIGNRFDKHLVRFVSGLRKEGVSFYIDIIDASMRSDKSESDCLYDKVYIVKRTCNSLWYKIPIISHICKYRDSRILFDSISSSYAIINIQYITLLSCVLSFHFNSLSAKIITTPWGSDIYRVSMFRRKLVRKVLEHSDYVTAISNTKFGNDIKKIFNVPEKKCIPLCFGSNVLDRISDSKIAKEDAKFFFVKNNEKYLIVCGYNASPAQNHLRIIDSLNRIKEYLPTNVFFVFPMTYAKKDAYIKEVKEKLDKLGVNYKILDSYLSDDEIVLLRKATDLFIHMQTTDAYSSTLHEYLLCGTKIINAEWLRYPELEQDSIPYVLSNFNRLSDDILACIGPESQLNLNNSTLRTVIESYKWSFQLKQWIAIFNKYL